MNNKKILGIPLTLFVLGLLVVGGASAALVGYLSNTVLTTQTVESPIVLQNGNSELDVSIEYGGEYDMALLTIENKASVPIEGNLEIQYQDSVGWHTAVSEDISYCFKSMGDMSNVEDCRNDFEQWVQNNPDWMDWNADASYSDSDYKSPYVVNTDGDSFVSVGYTGDSLVLPVTGDDAIPAETKAYAVVYFDTESRVAPGEQTIDVLFTPVTN